MSGLNASHLMTGLLLLVKLPVCVPVPVYLGHGHGLGHEVQFNRGSAREFAGHREAFR